MKAVEEEAGTGEAGIRIEAGEAERNGLPVDMICRPGLQAKGRNGNFTPQRWPSG